MIIPLLVGARPKFSSRGPEVYLGEGIWRVYTVNHTDTEFVVNCVDPDGVASHSKLDGHLVELKGPIRVWLEFVNRGKEDYITVLAEQKNANLNG